MKISEIILYPNREENIEKYTHYFINSNHVSAFSGLTFSQVLSSDEHYLGLFNQTKLAAILHLNVRDSNFWQITYTQTEQDFKGQGCFRYLITAAVNSHGSVLSDDHQTPQSKQAWKSLIQYPGPNLNIFVYDTDTQNKIPSTDFSENEIWNNKSNPVLLITNSAPESATNRESVMSKLKESTGIDRTNAAIWYGVASSTVDYTNP